MAEAHYNTAVYEQNGETKEANQRQPLVDCWLG